MAHQGNRPPGGRTAPGGAGAVSPFGETVAPVGMPPMAHLRGPAGGGPVVGGAAAEPTVAALARPNPAAVEMGPGVLLGDRYKLKRTVGSGGMGDVWEAQHVVIGKAVAVKILSDTAAASGESRLPERFMREARAIAAVQHENIVDITDFGHTPAGAPYFVMELLHGRTLKQLVKDEGAIPWERARPILTQLADGLEAVHAHGIIHRDLKPDNVFLLELGRGRETCKIIDFGIAKLTELDSEAQSFTRTGMVFGTPAFMSPEQARGEAVDVRTDVYSFGCVAYELITGFKPFDGSTPTEVLFKQLFTEPTAPRQMAPKMNIPLGVEAIVMKCLRKGPELRFSDMASLREAVQGVGTTAAMVVVPPERLPTPPTRPSFRDPGATNPSVPPAPGATLPETSPVGVSSWELGAPGHAPPSATGELLQGQVASGRVGTIVAVSMVAALAAGGGGFFAYKQFGPGQGGLATEAAVEVAAPADPVVVPTDAGPGQGATPPPAPVDPVEAPAAKPIDPDPNVAAEPVDRRSGFSRPRQDADVPLPTSKPSAGSPSPSPHLPPPPSLDDPGPAPASKPEPAPTPAPVPAPTPTAPVDAPATPPKPPPKKKSGDPDLLDPFG